MHLFINNGQTGLFMHIQIKCNKKLHTYHRQCTYVCMHVYMHVCMCRKHRHRNRVIKNIQNNINKQQQQQQQTI